MSNELKPCIFCGSNHVELVCSGSAWFVRCNECDANGATATDDEDGDAQKAVAAWNKPHDLLRRVAAESWRWAVSGTDDRRNDPPPREAPENAIDGVVMNVLIGGA